MSACGRYSCDGLHYLVGQTSDARTGAVLSERAIESLPDEQTFERENETDKVRATLAVARCLVCNPEPSDELEPETVAPTQDDDEEPAVDRWWDK